MALAPRGMRRPAATSRRRCCTALPRRPRQERRSTGYSSIRPGGPCRSGRGVLRCCGRRERPGIRRRPGRPCCANAAVCCARAALCSAPSRTRATRSAGWSGCSRSWQRTGAPLAGRRWPRLDRYLTYLQSRGSVTVAVVSTLAAARRPISRVRYQADSRSARHSACSPSSDPKMRDST